MSAVAERHSARGFLAEPVERALLEAIFTTGQRAPSWCNTQPWRVWVTTPPRTADLSAKMIAAAKSGLPHPDLPFPIEYPAPYQEHRRACGHELYGAMGIARDDKSKRYDAWLRNYAFFDAPHCAVVACDRRLLPYALIDVGVWLGYVLAEAAALSIATCAMASIAAYPDVLRAELGIPPDLAILFGIALGHEDTAVPANRCRTTREPLSANVTFV
jgi:nitroreductase